MEIWFVDFKKWKRELDAMWSGKRMHVLHLNEKRPCRIRVKIEWGS